MMKKVKVLFVAALAVLAVSTAVDAQTPVERYGQLKVVGNRIVDKDGDPVALRGMSFFWDQWQEGSQFYTAGAVSTLANDWKVDLVRVAYSGNSGNWDRAKTVIDAAIANGIYVIADWHSHSAENEVEGAKAFFKKVAEGYGNKPNIIYEIYNEPIAQTWSTIKNYATQVIPTIRANDANNIIVVGTRDYSKRVDEVVAASGPGPLTQYSNIAYTVHFYAAEAGTQHTTSLRVWAVSGLNGNSTNAGVPVFVTEWGVTEANGTGNIDTAQSKLWFEFMDEHQISWANWSIANKGGESSAAITGGGGDGSNWSLSTSGTFVRNTLRRYANTTASLTVNKTGQGETALSRKKIRYGAPVTITATPAVGWEFTRWEGSSISVMDATKNPYTTKPLYANTTITAVFAQGDAAGNLLTNGNFNSGLVSPWNRSGSAEEEVVNGELQLKVTTPGTTVAGIRISQTGLIIEAGKKYKLSFKAYAQSPRPVTANVTDGGRNINLAPAQEFQLTTTKAPYELEFTATQSTPATPAAQSGMVWFGFGGNGTTWYLDDVRLEVTGTSSVAAPAAAVKPFRAVLNGRTLSLAGGGRMAEVTVYDMAGRVRHMESVSLSSAGAAVTLGRLPAGVYTVSYKVDGKVVGNNGRIMLTK